ncbi:MAG TPA: hypothetical protein VKB38_01080, partial [Terracidiphilus sp.]|nr:hypothetical protein [Terracidiphilus sp.]
MRRPPFARIVETTQHNVLSSAMNPEGEVTTTRSSLKKHFQVCFSSLSVTHATNLCCIPSAWTRSRTEAGTLANSIKIPFFSGLAASCCGIMERFG